MAEIDYVPWATAVGASVYDAADYGSLPARPTGVQPGLADPLAANTAWRQSSMFAAAWANYISTVLGGVDVLDDGDVAALQALITAAVAAGSIIKPSRLVTLSTPLVINAADFALGFNRTAGVAAMTAALPASSVGSEFLLQDLVGNFQAAPVTVSPPAGTIAGRATFVMNEDRQSALFHYYGTNIWGVQT